MKGTEYMTVLHADGRIILKWLLNWMWGTDRIQLAQEPAMDAREHSNEPSCSIKGKAFDKLNYYQFL
jgi:hypothetical protein